MATFLAPIGTSVVGGEFAQSHGSVRNRDRVTGRNQQELAGTKRRGRAL